MICDYMYFFSNSKLNANESLQDALPGMSVMTPPTDLLGSCAPSLVHAERDSRFVMDGEVTRAGHLCYIMLLPNAQGKIVGVDHSAANID